MLINGIEITKGLIIRQPWVEFILSGQKTWEMRSTSTKVRGPFAIIEQGTGLIVGVANLVGVMEPMTLGQLMSTKHNHHVDYDNNRELLKWDRAWVLEDVKRIEPKPFQQKQGAVIWVNL